MGSLMGALAREDLAVLFDGVEDPRMDRRKRYPLCEIFFLSLYGALVGIESWRGLELIGNERLDFLRGFFPFSNGVPSHQTIARVFSLLDPKSFEQFFLNWMSQINGSNMGKQIALDGKTLRGSYDKANSKQTLHLLNACAIESGLCIGQMEVDTKTNEISVAPKLLDALDVKGAMISVDALNTQKDFAEKIIDKKANYTLALKGNHKNLNKEVHELMSKQKAESAKIQETDKKHGRLTTRTYDILPVNKDNLSEFSSWKGLLAVGRVHVLTLQAETQHEETRYYLLSYTDQALFAKSVRGHWGIENKLHWTLDVTFGEDASRKRKDHAPRNYSVIRKMGLNICRTFKEKLSVPLFQIKAGANPAFLATVLQNVGFNPRYSVPF